MQSMGEAFYIHCRMAHSQHENISYRTLKLVFKPFLYILSVTENDSKLFTLFYNKKSGTSEYPFPTKILFFYRVTILT